jgi:hypothetical protein
LPRHIDTLQIIFADITPLPLTPPPLMLHYFRYAPLHAIIAPLFSPLRRPLLRCHIIAPLHYFRHFRYYCLLILISYYAPW